MNGAKRALHIEGLRSLAILFICLFHLNGKTYADGYLGVEVFLVITGYFLFRRPLCTGDDMGADLAAIKDFAKKRLSRLLFPMGALVLLVCCTGFVFFTADEWVDAARMGVFSLLGVGNIYMEQASQDYFAQTTAYAPLFHLWYLGVTLQVLLFFAVYSFVLRRCSEPVRRGVLFVTALGSLAILYWDTVLYGVPSTGSMYYSTTARYWEVFAGAFIPFIPVFRNKWCNGLVALTALAVLILLMGGQLDNAYTAFEAVICTMLVIRFTPDTPLEPLIGNKLTAWTGAVSFALYLVHVPAYVWYRCFEMHCGYYDQTLMLGLACMAALVFHYGVVRIKKTPRFLVSATWLAAMGTALLVCGKDGFAKEINADSNSLKMPVYNDLPFCKDQEILRGLDGSALKPWETVFIMACREDLFSPTEPLLLIGDPTKKPDFILIGDSHAHMLYYGLNEFCKKHHLCGLFLCMRWTPITAYPTPQETREARERNAALLSWLAQHPEIHKVLIGQSWSGKFVHNRQDAEHISGAAADSAMESILAIQACGKEVYLFTQLPLIRESRILQYVRRCVRLGQPVDTALISCTWESYSGKHRSVYEYLGGMEQEGICKLLHLETQLLEDGCIYGFKDGKFLYWDDSHLSPAGSIEFIERMEEELLEALSH